MLLPQRNNYMSNISSSTQNLHPVQSVINEITTERKNSLNEYKKEGSIECLTGPRDSFRKTHRAAMHRQAQIVDDLFRISFGVGVVLGIVGWIGGMIALIPFLGPGAVALTSTLIGAACFGAGYGGTWGITGAVGMVYKKIMIRKEEKSIKKLEEIKDQNGLITNWNQLKRGERILILSKIAFNDPSFASIKEQLNTKLNKKETTYLKEATALHDFKREEAAQETEKKTDVQALIHFSKYPVASQFFEKKTFEDLNFIAKKSKRRELSESLAKALSNSFAKDPEKYIERVATISSPECLELLDVQQRKKILKTIITGLNKDIEEATTDGKTTTLFVNTDHFFTKIFPHISANLGVSSEGISEMLHDAMYDRKKKLEMLQQKIQTIEKTIAQDITANEPTNPS